MSAKDEDSGGSTASTMRREPDGIGEFLAGVRAALADLPPDELAEVLDDARTHLVELSEEPDAATDAAGITARLGTPVEYAADLRAAAGYPPAPQRRRPAGRARARLAVAGLVLSTAALALVGLSGEPVLVLVALFASLLALPVLIRDGREVASVAALPGVRGVLARRPRPEPSPRGVSAFVASLQPAWWVLRALVAAALVTTAVGGEMLLPLVLVAAVAVPLSVGLGRLSRRDRRWLWAVVPLNGLAAGLLVVAAATYGSSDTGPAPLEYSDGLLQDGEPVTDIRPYDAQGRPLSGVHLFDQDGRPVDAASDVCDDGSDVTTVSPRPYPRGSARYDDVTGQCAIVPPAPLVVAVPTGAPAPAQAATPATGATSPPGATTPAGAAPPTQPAQPSPPAQPTADPAAPPSPAP